MQYVPYLTLCMLRFLSMKIRADFFKVHNTLVLPIPTGTAAAAIKYIDEAIMATELHSVVICVAPLPENSRTSLTLHFANRARNPPDTYTGNKLFNQLVESAGGIPILHRFVGQALESVPNKELTNTSAATKVC